MSHPYARFAWTACLPLALVGCAGAGGGSTDLAPADFAIASPSVDDAQPHEDVSRHLQAAEQDQQTPGQQPPPVSGPSAPGTGSTPPATPDPAPDAEAEPGAQTPDDSPAATPRTTSAATPRSPDATRTPAASAEISSAPAAPATGEVYVVDGMVGQVNGRAIYAGTVLNPIHEQLAALGRQLPPSQFRERARQLIAGTLEGFVADALILGEAERELDERARMQLAAMVDHHREELMRQHGQGSLSLTEYNLMRTTGQTLDETLRDFRNQRVVQNYLRQRLFPHINVTRRAIERYYRDNPQRYSPQGQRVLRLIRVENQEQARQVADRLAAGESFAEVASSDFNLYRPGDGGLMDPIAGEAPFSEPALNEALTSLRPGDHAGPLKMGNTFAFTYLESLEAPNATSLRDAQLEIDRILREQQFQRLSMQYRTRLFDEGSYNPLSQMTDDLVQIAMARYAASPVASSRD